MNKITLATLPDASEQEVFDFVAAHLLKQGEAALEGGTCAYRTTTGLTCAVGCLMSDSEYDQSMEGLDVLQLIHKGLVISSRNDSLLLALQSVHDEDPPDIWHDALENLAGEYGLSAAVVRAV